MSLEIIQSLIASNIQQSIAGQEIEHAKLEFKKEWYNLKDDKGIAAFLKDTSAIANTVGPDGYLVIGFDTRSNQFHPVKFSDTGLRDSSELSGIIVKHVDRAFMIDYFPIEVEGHILNVIHIPPSLGKPHVIRNHKSWPGGNLREESHRIYVRRGSRIWEATKYDLDLMYYDRKNIQPEYQVYGTIQFSDQNFGMNYQEFNPHKRFVEYLTLAAWITLENTGRRTISLGQIELSFGTKIHSGFPERIIFKGNSVSNHKIILPPNDITHESFELSSLQFRGMDFQICSKAIEYWEWNKTEIPMHLTLHTTNQLSIPVIVAQIAPLLSDEDDD